MVRAPPRRWLRREKIRRSTTFPNVCPLLHQKVSLQSQYLQMFYDKEEENILSSINFVESLDAWSRSFKFGCVARKLAQGCKLTDTQIEQ